ncbi:uncharacterized protein LOC135936198 [Cloeon dipterum]|uniref:uncharacterized protein LOC135936198 n=1 Tax=Cloeon dipterum TaxID=197152 RepID=UPI0032203FAE
MGMGGRRRGRNYGWGLAGFVDGVVGAMWVSRRVIWLSASDLFDSAAAGLRDSNGAWMLNFSLPRPGIDSCHLTMRFSGGLAGSPELLLYRVPPALVGGAGAATLLKDCILRPAPYIWCICRIGTAVVQYGHFEEIFVGAASMFAGFMCGNFFEWIFGGIGDCMFSPPCTKSSILLGTVFIVSTNLASFYAAGKAGRMIREILE